MTDETDIVNLALQKMGTRTTVTASELTNETSNEAIQANLVLTKTRDQLLRMAPWDCALNYANLDWITALPGTPENTSEGTAVWEKGQPAPPWVYEYQYPVDCLRACFIVPQTNTGFAGGVPITTAVTGAAPTTWGGPAVRFKVAIDQFRPVTAAAVVAGGTGYVVGDIITLPRGATDEAPIGAPVKLRVATVAATAILTVTVVNQILGSATPQGGSYFEVQTGTIAQDETDGAGTGATFTLTQGVSGSQRVILTNQEYATLAYCKQIEDPNVMDPLFQEAWTSILGSYLCKALTGDKALSNMLIGETNAKIIEARKADGNEGLTVNDVTPDFIRVRGIYGYDAWNGNGQAFDWGGLWGSWA
jgi:hypothetical protein